MAKIDRYLIQSLRAPAAEPPESEDDLVLAESASFGEAFLEGAGGEATAGPQRMPMLVQAGPGWDGSEIPDLVVSSQVGSIVSCRGTERSLEALEQDPEVISVEASRPIADPDTASSLPFVRGDAVQAPPLSERGDGAIVAFFDTGIDVLHEAFLDATGKTRILAIWDQWDTTGPAPAEGYGSEHSAADVQRYVDQGSVPSRLGRDPGRHGTHVASIAAGRAAGSFAGGIAPESKILMVKSKIDGSSDDPSSIGYSHNHVDALAWVRRKAREARLPVVLNVSQGLNAGAHDGTSLLEAAFDEFSGGGRAPGLVVVKSAGNERGHRGHARLSLTSGSITDLQWESRFDVIRHQDVVEGWFDSSYELEFQLENPSGEMTPWISNASPEAVGSFTSGDGFDLDLDRLHHDNGDSRLLIRIARGGVPGPEAGTWTLRVQARTVHGGGVVHFWIERFRRRGLRFLNNLQEDYSLSIPGTARTVISVGSVRPADPLRLADSSSYGPTRDQRQKPDVCAPGDGIEAARAGTTGGVYVEGGTSMAAPHVSGAVALLLSFRGKQNGVPGHRQLNAAQIHAALRNTARAYNGSWNRGMGYGLLDARALVEYFR